MASPFPKFLWPIVVPAGGYTIAFDDGGAKTASLPAATYTTIIALLAALKTAMDGASAVNFTCAISALGIVTITGDAAWTWTAASTNATLKLLLGFTGSESVAENVLTASNQHRGGYYPGLETYSRITGNGVGPIDDTLWQPERPVVEQIAGDGTECAVSPDSSTWVRTIAFGKIDRTEYENTNIGLVGFWENCRTSQFRYYEDREDGAVGAEGTQNSDYYLCRLRKDGLELQISANEGEWRTGFSVRLNKEPVPA